MPLCCSPINMFILVNDYGPYVISALILISLLTIVWYQRPALVSLLWSSQTAEQPDSRGTHRWIRLLIVLLVSGIFTSGLLMQHYMRR